MNIYHAYDMCYPKRPKFILIFGTRSVSDVPKAKTILNDFNPKLISCWYFNALCAIPIDFNNASPATDKLSLSNCSSFSSTALYHLDLYQYI